MCFAGKASILAQRNKCYAYVVEGRKPKRSSRQILKDKCWFKQNLYMGGNKGRRKSDWMHDMKNNNKKNPLDISLFMKKEYLKFVTDSSTYKLSNWNTTSSQHRGLSSAEQSRLIKDCQKDLYHFYRCWVHSFPTPACWSVTCISFLDGNHPYKPL